MPVAQDSREGSQASKSRLPSDARLSQAWRHQGGCHTCLRDHLLETGHDVGALCLLVISKDPG